MGTDTDPLCQTGATTVDPDRPMRLHCRHDRAWLCPIGLVVASGGTVELVAIDENAAERRNAVLTRRRASHGHPRPADLASIALAESVCGASDWHRASRVPRSGADLQRGAPAY